MNEIRIWLDAEKIQPLEFKEAAGTDGIGFEVRFRDAAEAERFRKAF